MERAEAIKILEGFRYYIIHEDTNEALDLAIEALRKVSVYEQVKWERDWALKTLEEHGIGLGQIAEESATTTEVDYCNNCPYLPWDEDCISRADTVKVICEKCTQEGYDECREDCTEVAIVKGMPPVNQKQITGQLENAEIATSEGEESTMGQPKSKLDCISRQDAIEWFKKIINDDGQFTKMAVIEVVHSLESLPPVTPTEQTVKEIMDFIGGMNMVGEISNEAYAKISDYVDDGTPTEQNEEDILKFYYVESLDEYWIGQRCGTRYYGKWTGNCFTYGYSRYLPWGEHVVAPDTLWKEHTYPSEPKEIPFNEWLQGFLEKECQTERTGEWVEHDPKTKRLAKIYECPFCGDEVLGEKTKFCSNCGADLRAKMGGDE